MAGIKEPLPAKTATQTEATPNAQPMETEMLKVIEPQPAATSTGMLVTEPTKSSEEAPGVTKPPSTINTVRRKGEISAKEEKEFARTNGSMRTWLLQKKANLQLSSVQEEDEAMEVDDDMSWMESESGVDHGRSQRLSKCKVKQTEQQIRVLFASLAEELCTCVCQRAGVRAWLEEVLGNVGELTQAREKLRIIRSNQSMQLKLLEMIENHGLELARAERARSRQER